MESTDVHLKLVLNILEIAGFTMLGASTQNQKERQYLDIQAFFGRFAQEEFCSRD